MFILFITKVSECFKNINELTFTKQLWDEWYYYYLSFQLGMEVQRDYGQIWLWVFWFSYLSPFFCLPKKFALHIICTFRTGLPSSLVYLWLPDNVQEVEYWTVSLEGRNPSDELCSFWTVWTNHFHQHYVQTVKKGKRSQLLRVAPIFLGHETILFYLHSSSFLFHALQLLQKTKKNQTKNPQKTNSVCNH